MSAFLFRCCLVKYKFVLLFVSAVTYQAINMSDTEAAPTRKRGRPGPGAVAPAKTAVTSPKV